jgi:hypothetical protein
MSNRVPWKSLKLDDDRVLRFQRADTVIALCDDKYWIFVPSHCTCGTCGNEMATELTKDEVEEKVLWMRYDIGRHCVDDEYVKAAIRILKLSRDLLNRKLEND